MARVHPEPRPCIRPENFGVWVKDAQSTNSVDQFASTQVTVTAATCPTVTLTAAPTTVVHSSANGTHVTLTALATGCSSGATYTFWMRTDTTPWVNIRGYQTTATYDWNSTGAAVGTVTFGVWAKDGHSSNNYDSVANATVSVT